mgnify:CR=1 FL=1
MQGFDLLNDPGIPDGQTPAYCGYQQNFDRSRPGIEDETGLGYSGNELEGKLIAGNTFDYPFIHGKAIQPQDAILSFRAATKPLKADQPT